MHIVLIRHGRPEAASNPRVRAGGFARWVRAYTRSPVAPTSPPPDHLCAAVGRYYLVASGLRRAIHSAQLCAGRTPDQSLATLNEMDIPRYRLPLRMRAYAWLYLCRALWFMGLGGRFETYTQAKARARSVALTLDALARREPRIAVFGHGMINLHVARALRDLGWQGQVRGQRYWGEIHLSRGAGARPPRPTSPGGGFSIEATAGALQP